MDISNFLNLLRGVRESSTGNWRAFCPAHDDQNPSISIKEEEDGKILIHCFANCTPEDIATAVGLTMSDLFIHNANHYSQEEKLEMAFDNIQTTYPYYDEKGKLLYEAVRYYSKKFSVRRPNQDNTGYIWNIKDTRRVLYNLPGIINAKENGLPIFIVEGEKDVHNLQEFIGNEACVTTNVFGAGKYKWLPEYTNTLKDCNVVILPDSDPAGISHAQFIAQALHGTAKSVKYVVLPDLPEKGDVSDWIDQGHTANKFCNLVEKTPYSQPSKTEKQSLHNGKLTLTPIGDLMNEPEEDIQWLVEDLLPAKALSGLYSKPKAGKSTLARCLALHVARGTPFLGKATLKGTVFYLSFEEQKRAVVRHFKNMGAMLEDNIYIFTGRALADLIEKLHCEIKEKKPVLIILDTIFRAAQVRDVNDYAQVTKALDPLLEIAHETGCHVMFLHHTNKGMSQGGDSILGSTANFGSVDVALIIKRYEKYRTISSDGRYGENLDEAILCFDFNTKTISLGGSKEEEEIKSIEEAILEFLSGQSEAVCEKEIQEKVEGRNKLKVSGLRALHKEGKVMRSGSGKKGDSYRYSIVQYTTVENAATLLPNISQEPEYQNIETIKNLHHDDTDSGSQNLDKNGVEEDSQELEFFTSR